MLFAILCTDKPASLDLRMETRPPHVEYLKSLGATLRLAGPFLGADEKPCGSMLIVDAKDSDAAKAIAAGDPYAEAGLFETTEIRRWNWTFGNPDASAV
ncbi:MAG: hypothetical protein H7Y08_02980 [Rhizobiaceae bacterium]|nr:hypothetical protein [Rhizobiaceae bacterium]